MSALAQPAAAGQHPANLARFRAERRAEAIRSDLKGAAAMLREARDEEDWRELGHASHGAYVLDRFGDVLEDLRLATEDRDAVALAMRAEGASYSKVQRRLDISAGTVRNILNLHGDPAPEKTVGEDGRARSARALQPSIPASDGTPVLPLVNGIGRDNHTVKVVTAAGPTGLTVHELCKRAKVKQGAASISLSRVHRAGRLVRTTTYRDGCAVYVDPQFVVPAS